MEATMRGEISLEEEEALGCLGSRDTILVKHVEHPTEISQGSCSEAALDLLQVSGATDHLRAPVRVRVVPGGVEVWRICPCTPPLTIYLS